MTDLQIYLTLGIFAAVIVVIAVDAIDMALAALLGVGLMVALGILKDQDFFEASKISGGPLALLFGGMVVAHVLARSGIFERVGAMFLRATAGSGKRFLLLLVALVAPVCALLPNATTVILLAPIVIAVCRAMKIDFVGPMILMALVSNSAGLLTLVGDPATFLVGSSIGMSFADYLKKVSLGGLLAVLVVIPLLPRLMPEVWRSQRALEAEKPLPPIERPGFVALAICVLVFMVLMFLFGEQLPVQILPPEVSIIAAALGLLVIYGAKVETVDEALRAVDWKTLLFLGAIFCLVQGFTKTGLLQGAALKMHDWLGIEFTLVAMAMLAGIGVLSSVLANTPVVAAALIMIKGYLVAAEVVPEEALAAGFSDWPAALIPVFVAMMFGGTLGGNATLIGASANVVSAGICASHGKRVTFLQFMRYGLPVAACQLAIGAVYVLAMIWLLK